MSDDHPAPRSHQAARWLADHGGAMADAGLRFGVTRQAVWMAWRILFGDRRPPSFDERSAAVARIAELADQGRTRPEIAREVQKSRAAIDTASRRRGLKIRTMSAAIRARAAEAVAAVAAGARRVDAAIDHDVSEGALGRALRESGVSTVASKMERDGRTARAVERVLDGASVSEACRIERCSSPGVYKALQRLKNKAA